VRWHVARTGIDDKCVNKFVLNPEGKRLLWEH